MQALLGLYTYNTLAHIWWIFKAELTTIDDSQRFKSWCRKREYAFAFDVFSPTNDMGIEIISKKTATCLFCVSNAMAIDALATKGVYAYRLTK